MAIVESSGISDVGKKRTQNEDSLFYDDALGLYVVADGMGGHLAGEVASRIVVDTIRDYIKQQKTTTSPPPSAEEGNGLSREANDLLASIQLSNKMVHQTAHRHKSYRGMGSTVSAIYFTDKTFIVANVGDSPIYLIRDGRIELMSALHTVLAEQTALDPKYVALLGQEFKHVLTRAMGIEESVDAHIYETPFYRNDILVIGSDGLSDKASPEEILNVVANNNSDKACRDLVDLANHRGGDDNVTAIVLRVINGGTVSRGFRTFLTCIFNKLNVEKNCLKRFLKCRP